jgi:hypothetical protein
VGFIYTYCILFLLLGEIMEVAGILLIAFAIAGVLTTL